MNFVILKCNGDQVDTRHVKTKNIHEGPQGEDVLTYLCPRCNKTHEGTVYRK